MKRWAKIFLVVVAALFLQCESGAAAPVESSVLLRWGDETRFYRIPSADVLSSLMLEKMNESGKFTLRENFPVAVEQGKKIEPSTTGRAGQAGQVGQIGQDGQTEQAGQEDKVLSSEILKVLGAKYDARFAVYGEITRLESRHTVYRELGQGASIAGQIADVFTGGIVGSVLGMFGGAATAKDTLEAAAHIYVLDLTDGRCIWDKEITAAEKISGKGDPNLDMVTTAGGLTVNKTIAKALDSLAAQAVKLLIEEVGSNRLLIKK